MKKWVKRLAFLLAAVSLLWLGGVLADREKLSRELVRLHVLANSDSEADQSRKLAVRDAVVSYLEENMKNATDMAQARAYLAETLPQLQRLAEQTLQKLGCTDPVTVTLGQEPYPQRSYEGFRLPAGVYQSLRIVIGEGEGQNWWCVVYPALCLGEFDQAAETGGFSRSLTGALTGEQPFEVRFFLLEWLGKLENFFFRR